MRQVAIAYATTGPSPKMGHRISEIFATEQQDGTATGRTLHLQFKTDDTQADKRTFAETFDSLDGLIGDAPIVVRHAGHWRKFLRGELRPIKKRGARRLMKQTIDVNGWAHSRYPKQRKSLAAIAQRVGVIVAPELSGLKMEAEQLRLIANVMKSSEVKTQAHESPTVSTVGAIATTPSREEPAEQNKSGATATSRTPEEDAIAKRLADRLIKFFTNR